MPHRYLLDAVVVTTLLSAGAPSLASERQVPLKELVRDATAVLTGRTVAQEKRAVAAGVFEVTQYVAVEEVLKGNPLIVELATMTAVERRGPVPVQSNIDAKDILQDEMRTVKAVRIRFFDGAMVPSGKVTYDLGERGVWFLYAGPGAQDQPGVYQAAARHDLASLNEIRRRLGGPKQGNADGPAGGAPEVEPEADAVERHRWFERVLARVETVKPGVTTFEEFSKLFEVDGGLQTIPASVYCYRACRYVKVTVTFDGLEKGQHPNPGSKIATVSKPYVERPHCD